MNSNDIQYHFQYRIYSFLEMILDHLLVKYSSQVLEDGSSYIVLIAVKY